jgi:NADH dehydrogenase FAD-containing subunit
MSINDQRKSVIVVGGGAAGVNVARPLSAQLDATKFKLILINPRPFRILLPATLRMIVSSIDTLEATALVPFDKLFHAGHGLFIQDSVQDINQNVGQSSGTLTLGSGQQLTYDILVLATGLLWKDPISFPDSVEDVMSYVDGRRAEFAKAKSYLLVGGGAVGCELAGELKDVWPEKDVTIVHREHLLLNKTYPDRFRMLVARNLTERGVRIHLSNTVKDVPEEPGSATITTQDGLELGADLVLLCTGTAHPNTAFMRSLKMDVLTSAGYVKVKPTLQLLSYPNIFVAGDILDWQEQKQALKSTAHAQVVVKNVLSYIKGAPLKSYSTSLEGISLTNGKNGGLTYLGILWGIILGAWFTCWVKSRSLLVPMFRKESGLY